MKEKFDITIDGIKAKDWKAQKQGRAFVIAVVDPDEDKEGCNTSGWVEGQTRDISIIMHSLFKDCNMRKIAILSLSDELFNFVAKKKEE